jgi:hypothetical protein
MLFLITSCSRRKKNFPLQSHFSFIANPPGYVVRRYKKQNKKLEEEETNRKETGKIEKEKEKPNPESAETPKRNRSSVFFWSHGDPRINGSCRAPSSCEAGCSSPRPHRPRPRPRLPFPRLRLRLRLRRPRRPWPSGIFPKSSC